MGRVKKLAKSSANIRYTDCTINPSYVPYGMGDNLLKPSDLIETLSQIGVSETSGTAGATPAASPVAAPA